MENNAQIDRLIVRFLLGDNSEAAIRAVAAAAYEREAGTAYAGYLRLGRGALLGPLTTRTGDRSYPLKSLEPFWQTERSFS